jgi:hypothetical protein
MIAGNREYLLTAKAYTLISVDTTLAYEPALASSYQ